MVLIATFFHLLKYPLVSGLRSEWGSSCREVPLPDPSAALSYFSLFPSFPSSLSSSSFSTEMQEIAVL